MADGCYWLAFYFHEFCLVYLSFERAFFFSFFFFAIVQMSNQGWVEKKRAKGVYYSYKHETAFIFPFLFLAGIPVMFDFIAGVSLCFIFRVNSPFLVLFSTQKASKATRTILFDMKRYKIIYKYIYKFIDI